MTLLLLKATRETRFFKPGQKLWAVWSTGALAAPVATRFKGTGRWVYCWAHWEDPEFAGSGRSFNGRADARWIGRVKVSMRFAKQVEKVMR